jgi:hypothetical protein
VKDMNKKEWIDAEIIDLGVESTEASPKHANNHDGVIIGTIQGFDIFGHQS